MVIVTGPGSSGPDGTILVGETVTHSYSQPGKRDIELTVTDDGGATGQATHRHVVQGPPAQSPP